jgi:hypothetical protein
MSQHSMVQTDEAAPALNNTNLARKSATKKKASSRPVIRKARPLKNLSRGDLDGRLRELQKRLTTADCKTVLLRDRLEAHSAEIALRDAERAAEEATA